MSVEVNECYVVCLWMDGELLSRCGWMGGWRDDGWMDGTSRSASGRQAGHVAASGWSESPKATSKHTNPESNPKDF